MDYGQFVSGGLGLIGSALQYKYNQALAAQQNQYNIDMWKMQADYNSPQAQMQRFQEAGLNPNLIYGQGNNGNMSQAPQMVTPQAPELSKQMQRLGEAFNIENLLTTIANRKKAQADARIAETTASDKFIDYQRNINNFDAEIALGTNYEFNPLTGAFVFNPRESSGEKIVEGAARYFMNRVLEKNVLQRYLLPAKEANIVGNTGLIPYRRAFLHAQRLYLAPQIAMSIYEQEHQPTSYWIGQGTKVLNSLTSIPATFSPLRWIPRNHLGGSY